MPFRLFETQAAKNHADDPRREDASQLRDVEGFGDDAAQFLRAARRAIGHNDAHPEITASLQNAEADLVSVADQAQERAYEVESGAGMTGPGGRA